VHEECVLYKNTVRGRMPLEYKRLVQVYRFRDLLRPALVAADPAVAANGAACFVCLMCANSLFRLGNCCRHVVQAHCTNTHHANQSRTALATWRIML